MLFTLIKKQKEVLLWLVRRFQIKIREAHEQFKRCLNKTSTPHNNSIGYYFEGFYFKKRRKKKKEQENVKDQIVMTAKETTQSSGRV